MCDSFQACFRLRCLTGGYPVLVRTTLAALALYGSASIVRSGSITTTIYVGHDFEVRDHDQPTKYVFNGSTRVAEITGSLSSNLRVQRLRLYPGWNLCSVAVSGPFPASGADVISSAYQWNSGTGDYSQIALGQSLAAGTVLWIKAGTNADVSVLGTYSDPAPQPLQAGGAYSPGAGLEAWVPALPDTASSWNFDAPTGQWFDHLAGDLTSIPGPPPTLSAGQAFYLQAAAPALLQIPDPTLRIRYYHQDHLGSSSVVSDAAGAPVEETSFYPYGARRNENRLRQSEEPYKFTQKERDAESGLHYFEARYLAGALARFVTADPKYANPDMLSTGDLASFLSVPQELNLYTYVGNDPLGRLDPTGLDISTPLDGRQVVARRRDGSVVVALHQGPPIKLPQLCDSLLEGVLCTKEVTPVVNVTIVPDTFNQRTQGGVANTGIEGFTPQFSRRNGKITASFTIRIFTKFPRGTTPADPVLFGRGTTPDDTKAKNVSVGFHEGQHGARILDFIATHPLPQVKDNNVQQFNNDLANYMDELENFHVQQTDCVGRSDPTANCHPLPHRATP